MTKNLESHQRIPDMPIPFAADSPLSVIPEADEVLKTVLALRNEQVFVHDRAGQFVYSAGLDAAEKAAAGRASDLPLTEILDVHAIFAEKHHEVRETRRPVRGVVPADSHISSTKYEYTICPVLDKQGDVAAFVMRINEVGDAHEAIEALRDSELKYRTLADTVPQLVWIAKPDGRPEYFNSRLYEYTGLELDEARVLGMKSIIHSDDLIRVTRAWAKSVRTLGSYDTEFRLKRKSGEYGWVLARGVPLQNEDGGVVRWIGTCTDIDTQKHAAEREHFFAELTDLLREFQNSTIGIQAVIQSLGRYLDVPRCMLTEIDASEDTVNLLGQYARELEPLPQTLRFSDFRPPGSAWFSQDSVTVVTDVLSYPSLAPPVLQHYQRAGVRAFISLALHRDRSRYLLLSVASDVERHWTPEDIATVQRVVERLSLTADNARLEALAAESAERQRIFVRDVLSCVTDGRLRLCHLEAELPAPLERCSEDIRLDMTGGIRELRRALHQAGEAVGLAPHQTNDLEIAVGEAAMNAVVHAGEGTGMVKSRIGAGLQVWVHDSGSGISLEHLPQATLEPGYSTKATFGHGFKMMLQSADRVYLLTNSSGTTVVIEQYV